MITRLLTFILIVALMGTTALEAHDIWLSVDQFRMKVGDTLVVHQYVGEDLQIEQELPLMPRITPRFELITSGSRFDFLAILPDDWIQTEIMPVAKLRMNVEGPVLVVMEHAFIHMEMTNDKFQEYMVHESIDSVIYVNAIKSGTVQRERYARYFKCLVQVGETSADSLILSPVGQKLEIIPMENPLSKSHGEEIEFQVLFNGEPLPNWIVAAINDHKDSSTVKQRKRTNSQGIVRFRLNSTGLWLIHLVYVTQCDERTDVDWTSYWAALTFIL